MSRLFFKAVAVVPTGAMFGPETHAHPAEFVFALTAGHMITTAILFNRRYASGALFGVGGYPVGSLGVVLAFLEPHHDQCTRGGLMIGNRTAETEFMFTSAPNGWDYASQVAGFYCTVNSILAVWCRAPS
jgi:hypothetical protein